MEDFTIRINYYEVGLLLGSIEKRDRLTPRLRLQLDILACKAYLKHPTMGKQAKKDIEKMEKELAEVEQQNEKQ